MEISLNTKRIESSLYPFPEFYKENSNKLIQTIFYDCKLNSEQIAGNGYYRGISYDITTDEYIFWD